MNHRSQFLWTSGCRLGLSLAIALVAGACGANRQGEKAVSAAASAAPTAVPDEAKPPAIDGGGSFRLVNDNRHREGPSERATPAAATIGKSIYVFAGARDDFRSQQWSFFDDLYRFDTMDNHWERLSPQGRRPPARGFSAGVADEANGNFYIFGGTTYEVGFANFRVFDDLWRYSVGDDTWTEVIAENEGPVARVRPNLWFHDGRIHVFGGFKQDFRATNDLWAYDIATNEWAELIAEGGDPSGPAPRQESVSGNNAVDGKVVVFGGVATSEDGRGFLSLADTWVLDLENAKWTEVKPVPTQYISSERNYAAAAVIGNSLYLHGGDVEGGDSGCGAPYAQAVTSEIWQFDLGRRAWRNFDPQGTVPLKRTVASAVGDTMYIFGGYDFECDGETNTGPGQTWNENVYAYTPPS